MARLIIKITDPKDNTPYYMEWSTVVDAPVTNGMSSLYDFQCYYKEEYGNQGYQDLEGRIEQVEKTGCSSRITTLEDLLQSYNYNRGKSNDPLTEILNEYCRDQ